MSADSFHHVVEKGIKQAKRVEDFSDFSDFIIIINEHGEAHDMEFFDFFDIPKGVSHGKDASKNPILDKSEDGKVCEGFVCTSLED